MGEHETNSGKDIEVEIWTEHYKFKGKLFLPLGGTDNSRLSDFLNESNKTFLAITDVTAQTTDENVVLRCEPFVAINKIFITLIRPLDE
jgi:hypothetical protein